VLTVIAAMLGVVVALALPLLVLIGFLMVADWVHRRRLRVVARQVAVTDAIHREFGAVVAPVVRKQLWGPWIVSMALPPEGWATAGSLAAIAREVVSAGNGSDIQVVLTPRKELARMA